MHSQEGNYVEKNIILHELSNVLCLTLLLLPLPEREMVSTIITFCWKKRKAKNNKARKKKKKGESVHFNLTLQGKERGNNNKPKIVKPYNTKRVSEGKCVFYLFPFRIIFFAHVAALFLHLHCCCCGFVVLLVVAVSSPLFCTLME